VGCMVDCRLLLFINRKFRDYCTPFTIIGMWSYLIPRAANSIEFYLSSSLSSTYFSKSEFKFEFSNLIIYEFEFRKNIFSSSSLSSAK